MEANHLSSKKLPRGHQVPQRHMSEACVIGGFPQYTTCKYKEYPNLEHNAEMEDVGIIYKNIDGFKNSNLYCIFDGHGSNKCSKLCAEFFGKYFEKYHKENPINTEYCFNMAFKKMDEKAQTENCIKYGSTATAVYIEKNSLTCANVGDSSCMVVTNKDAIKLSVDHTCELPEEEKRIKLAGGRVIPDPQQGSRLEGVLILSRSIGDYEFKNKGLSYIPYIAKRTITSKDRYCVIASDGVWDAVKEKDLFKLSVGTNDADDFCEKIVKEAVDKGSEDNISCIVVAFH